MKSFRTLFITLFFLLLSISTFAQQEEIPAISPDRPGVGTPPSVIPAKTFQIESGFLYEKSSDGTITKRSYSYEQTLFRYGLLSFAELRLQTDYTKTTFEPSGGNNSIKGFGPIQVGSKTSLFKGKGIIPVTSILCNFVLPYFGEEEYKPSHIAPSVYLLFQNNLSSKLTLGYNIGLKWDGENSNPSRFYAVNLGIGLSDKVSCYVENYGYFNSDSSDFYVDAGIAYLLKNNIQLDIYGGINTKGSSTYSQVSFGISWRFPK